MPTEPSRVTRIKLKDTIAYHLLKVVFAIYFIFAASITGYHMYLDYQNAEQQIVARLGLIEKAFKDSLSTALFDLDTEQLQSILEGLHEMHALVGVKLQSSNPDIFIPDAAIGVIVEISGKSTLYVDENGAHSSSQTPYDKLIRHDFVLNQPGTQIEIARGTLYSSTEVVFESVKGHFIRLVISAIIKTALLWMLFLWAAAGRLSHPLREFADDVAQIDLDSETEPPISAKGVSSRHDELKVLSQAFHAMQLRMHRYIGDLRKEKRAAEAARSEAEQANAAKSAFLSRMGHELRTPLNAIIGFSDIQLSRTPENSPDKRQLRHILEAGNHLLKLVNDVMGIVDANETAFALTPCCIDEIINRCIQTIQVEHGAEVGINHQTSGLYAQANEEQLERVLLSLLSNAVLYNNENGSVMVRAHVVEKEVIRIEIKDTGVGIAKQDQEVIFEPFQRLAYAENHKIPGAGMGLVLAKAFVEAMNGKLGLSSEPGSGSTFWVELAQSEAR